MNLKITLLAFYLLIGNIIFAQQPKYTFKKFVRAIDTTEFKIIYPKGDGFIRTYIISNPQIWDIDDNNTTFIKNSQNSMLCIEGQKKDNKREGVFKFYLIDSADHSKKYRIWEQNYSNGYLNGQWRTYTLSGTLVNFQTFKNDSLNGITRNFWIDGKTIMSETEYFNGQSRSIERTFFNNGKLRSEIPYEKGKITGVGKKYYEDGRSEEIAEFTDGNFNGIRKYFYPNGQLWIEQIYKTGKNWTVVANYTDKGQKRNAGTLHEGNGTIIFYNDDGTVREIKTYINGIEKK